MFSAATQFVTLGRMSRSIDTCSTIHSNFFSQDTQEQKVQPTEMYFNYLLLLAALGRLSQAEQMEKRLNNGLGKTPALGWNSYVS